MMKTTNAKPLAGFSRTQPAGPRLTKAPAPRPGLHVPGQRRAADTAAVAKQPVIVLRREIGEVLRAMRQRQGRTLREVSGAARVSLGYLSEVERGQKEASSELLASICEALHVPMWVVLREVSDRVALAEGVHIPDTVPVEMCDKVRAGDMLAQV